MRLEKVETLGHADETQMGLALQGKKMEDQVILGLTGAGSENQLASL